jgi:hypothetical protein
MQGTRESWAKHERAMEARQCQVCRRWFTRKASSRTICFYCEGDGQAPGSQ